jgi:hypothetical protein
MAKDNLEEFIRNNKEEFDDQVPSEKVWKNISRKLPVKNYIKNESIWWKVAAIIFFFTTATLSYQNYVKSDASGAELVELEEYYFNQIDYKKSLVSNISPNDAMLPGLEQDLQKLDAMYRVLKEEWERKPSKQVLEALTLNLLVRLDLLNRQLEVLSREEMEESRSS